MKPAVLVVDDDQSFCKMMCEILDEEGYDVSAVAHGGPALDRMRASPQRLLVLLGLNMPYVDGEQVLEAVVADPALAARHRIILVTAAVDRASSGRVAALRERLDVPLVRKPFDVSEFLVALEAVAAAMG